MRASSARAASRAGMGFTEGCGDARPTTKEGGTAGRTDGPPCVAAQPSARSKNKLVDDLMVMFSGSSRVPVRVMAIHGGRSCGARRRRRCRRRQPERFSIPRMGAPPTPRELGAARRVAIPTIERTGIGDTDVFARDAAATRPLAGILAGGPLAAEQLGQELVVDAASPLDPERAVVHILRATPHVLTRWRKILLPFRRASRI